MDAGVDDEKASRSLPAAVFPSFSEWLVDKKFYRKGHLY